MKRAIIRGAEVVFPNEQAKVDVLIEDGKIASIDCPTGTVSDEVIDASGMLLFPGLVDDQVHFREPGLTHKEDLATASAACAAGGVTSFLEMPNTKPNAIDMDRIRDKYRLASQKSIVNYGFYIGATCQNIDALQSATDVPGIKIFIGSSTGDLLVDDQEALERIFAETSLPICAHCEDESTIRSNEVKLGKITSVADHSVIRDEAAAIIATKRAIDLAIRHRHRFHVLHVSTAAEVPIIAAAGGPYITAEACPHHLFFSTDDYSRLGNRIQMNPSIKSPANQAPLWQALRDNSIQVIATDHAPHTLDEKAANYPVSPSGLPAVENYFALMLDTAHRQGLSNVRLAQLCCDAPARIWGIVGKGRIEVGYDADLVIVDPNRVRTIHDADQFTKSKWSPWNGTTLTGWPIRTIVGGVTVFTLPSDQSIGHVESTHRGQQLQFDHQRGGYWATQDGIGLS
jgi:dihydroorotase